MRRRDRIIRVVVEIKNDKVGLTLLAIFVFASPSTLLAKEILVAAKSADALVTRIDPNTAANQGIDLGIAGQYDRPPVMASL